MKIIEALKELPLLEKRILKNNIKIQEYASYATHVGPVFDSEDTQRTEIGALVQSTEDLVTRWLKLRRVLTLTNASVQVTINAITHTISEWISFNNRGADLLLGAYTSLSIKEADAQLRKNPPTVTEKDVGIRRMYDQKSRDGRISAIEDTKDKIDAKLEIVNATTDLIEEV